MPKVRKLEMPRANSDATFDYTAELLAARTLAQVVEISSAHMRKQIEQLAALAQQVASHTAEPMKDGLTGVSTAKTQNGGGSPVRGVRMQRPDGVMVRVVPLDPHSPTFDDDLTLVFQRNIARARRENKKLFGSPDGLPARK